jgi:hypothetical protein
MNRLFTLIVVALAAISCSQKESMEELTARVFERAAAQVKYMDTCLDPIAASKGEAVLPRSINPDGTFCVSDYKWWCSGFYPGTLWFVYEYTGDETVKALAQKYQTPLEPIRFRTNHHDVGFQLMCSYGNCLRLTGDQESEAILKDGANSLATRFDPEVGCTRSWNNPKWTFPVIVDNMMNLELLLKGAELTGDTNLKDIALTHSRTTMKNHYREDFSSYHLPCPLCNESFQKLFLSNNQRSSHFPFLRSNRNIHCYPLRHTRWLNHRCRQYSCFYNLQFNR